MNNQKIQKMLTEYDNWVRLKGILSYLGEDTSTLQELITSMEGIIEKAKEVAHVPNEFDRLFVERGWVAYDSLSAVLQERTIHLAKKGLIDEAEKLLVDQFDEPIGNHLTVLDRKLERLNHFLPRYRTRHAHLLVAKNDYFAENFIACVPVILMNIDGLACDHELENIFREVNSLESLPGFESGHPINSLGRLFQKLSYTQTKTTTSPLTLPYRNKIIHGRALGYDNKMVAAKAWASLFALGDALIAKNRLATKEAKSVKDIPPSLMDKTKEWQPRLIRVGIDIPINGMLDEYGVGTPEREMVKWFEYWRESKRNYGEMTRLLCLQHYFETENKTIGWLRALLSNVKLSGFKLMNIKDIAEGICDISASLDIEYAEESAQREFSFRLINQDDEANIYPQGVGPFKWRILIKEVVAAFYSELGDTK